MAMCGSSSFFVQLLSEPRTLIGAGTGGQALLGRRFEPHDLLVGQPVPVRFLDLNILDPVQGATGHQWALLLEPAAEVPHGGYDAINGCCPWEAC